MIQLIFFFFFFLFFPVQYASSVSHTSIAEVYPTKDDKSPGLLAVQDFFLETNISDKAVKTFDFLQKMGCLDYEFDIQYDAHEHLIQLLHMIYPTIKYDCIFKVPSLQSV